MNKQILLIMISILTMGSQCTDVDVADHNVADTMVELNKAWHKGYRDMLADIGTRHYPVKRSAAFTGMKNTMERLGFTVETSEGDYYLSVTIPAGKMFTDQEWQIIRRNEEPQMREIATRHLGIKGSFARLEPEGLLIDGKITLLESDDGTDISLTFRLKTIKPQPPESVLPRREYPPPYAARLGFEKIWHSFEELTLPVSVLTKAG